MPKHRSVSQYNTYARCAYRYKLERLDKVWQRPASWLSQGLGVHKAMEEWELSDRKLSLPELEEIYTTEFARSITEQAEETPNFDYWFGSGPYSGPVDIERRLEKGREQLRALVEYSLSSTDKPWVTPDGEKAIELEFNVELGGVRVKGFIDQVIEREDGSLLVRDIKTGAKPGDIFQLATYAEALETLYDVEVSAGDFFMGKTGKPTKTFEITDDDKLDVHHAFEWLEEMIQTERFEPSPSKKNCAMCAVKTSCEFKEG